MHPPCTDHKRAHISSLKSRRNFSHWAFVLQLHNKDQEFGFPSSPEIAFNETLWSQSFSYCILSKVMTNGWLRNFFFCLMLQPKQVRFAKWHIYMWNSTYMYKDTWNLGERKGKERKIHNRFPTMHAHRQRREKTTKNVYSTSIGSAALPGSEASNYTYTKVQRKTTEGTREKTKGISSTPTGQTRERERERMKKKRERKLGLGSGVKG